MGKKLKKRIIFKFGPLVNYPQKIFPHWGSVLLGIVGRGWGGRVQEGVISQARVQTDMLFLSIKDTWGQLGLLKKPHLVWQILKQAGAEQCLTQLILDQLGQLLVD